MNSNKKTARIVGVLFLTAMVTWFIGYFLTESILNVPDYLINISANEIQLIIGALFELINVFAVVGIAILMFPILKKYNKSIARGYLGSRILEGAMLIIGVISSLVLIILSQKFIKSEALDASYFQTLGTLAMGWRYWSGQMVPILVGLGGLMLCYLLYQSKLIPRFISVWGFIGYALLMPVPLLEIFGNSSGMILSLPGGLFELFLAVWLIVKGFNPSAIASEFAKGGKK